MANEETDRDIYEKIMLEAGKLYEPGTVDYQVTVKEGKVTVTGSVDNGTQRYVMDAMLKRIEGVQSYENKMTIR
ncbi:BON domain-containing protein [Candidatus Terasakiella magnetica]|nr:BON domain-containing protein [Candidatus Terasakiella magnetica]